MKGKAGVKEPYTPPLDVRVTIPETEAGVHEIVDLLTQAITRNTGTVVATGLMPQGRAFTQLRTTVVARDEPARDVLWRVLQSVRPDLSWALLCEVGEKSACYISIHQAVRGVVHPAFQSKE